MPTLIVQMGHCFRTTGATGTNGEQHFATAVADACVALLNGRGGWSVRKIGADESISKYRGQAFVAVHCDGSTSAAARGASVGYWTSEGQAFGRAWKRAYAERGWPGFRPDNYTTALAKYYGTGKAVAQGNRRAIIIECGFLTNAEDRALLTGPHGAARVALAIGDALGIPTESPAREGNEDMPMVSGTLAPATDPAKPGRQYIALPPVGDTAYVVKHARLHVYTGHGNHVDWKVWCVTQKGTYTAEKMPFKFEAESDRPTYFSVPNGTAGIAIEWTTTKDISAGWTLECVQF